MNFWEGPDYMILPFQHERSTSMLILMAMGTRQELDRSECCRRVLGWIPKH